jgi:hypothetical protein
MFGGHRKGARFFMRERIDTETLAFRSLLFRRFSFLAFWCVFVSHQHSFPHTRPLDHPVNQDRTATWFDASLQRTLEWLSLPVLAVPFWGRPPWLPRAPSGKQQA